MAEILSLGPFGIACVIVLFVAAIYIGYLMPDGHDNDAKRERDAQAEMQDEVERAKDQGDHPWWQ